ncbi:hypothetical protein CsSME_00032319 [Camellia sinensis var. sinensis]
MDHFNLHSISINRGALLDNFIVHNQSSFSCLNFPTIQFLQPSSHKSKKKTH